MSSLEPAVPKTPGLAGALPFWASMALVPVLVFAILTGGLAILLIPAATWGLFAVLDVLFGKDSGGLDPDTPEDRIYWYELVTRVWPFVQFAILIGALAYVPNAPHLSGLEQAGVFFGIGVLTGTIGIVYSHELMHRPDRLSRWLADLLLGMVMYGHFRSEHLLVHHRYVGTPRDAVSARRGEGFHRFFLRVVPGCFVSAWRAEAALQRRSGRSVFSRRNPFWRYLALEAGFLALAAALAGWVGVALFLFQALVAIWQLELVNYVEHYGLTRAHLGEGRYEPTRPHHSWNATQRASNWLLINLQRHSDHHIAPSRPFPLLQAGTGHGIPQLPRGYPVMTTLALVPPLWRRVMDPRVARWRETHYPEIEDWSAYEAGTLPLPR